MKFLGLVAGEMNSSYPSSNWLTYVLIPITFYRILYICIACTLSSVHVLHASGTCLASDLKYYRNRSPSNGFLDSIGLIIVLRGRSIHG